MFKRLLKILIFVFIAGLIIYKFFFYIDLPNGCFVTIKPSLIEPNIGNIKQSIKILKYAVPDEYQKFCVYVSTINTNISCGGFGGGCYDPSITDIEHPYANKNIYVSTASNSFLGWTAAVIAHETCHVIQDISGKSFSEQECHEIDDKVLKTIVQY